MYTVTIYVCKLSWQRDWVAKELLTMQQIVFVLPIAQWQNTKDTKSLIEGNLNWLT